MKKISLVFIFVYLVFADNLFYIHKKIVPISILQVDGIENINTINFVIATSKNDILKANEFLNILPNKIEKHNINKDIVFYKNLYQYLSNHSVQAIYFFDLTKEKFSYIQHFLKEKRIITFASSYKDFLNGALIFIDFTDRIHIYLNKKSMKKFKIPFLSQFLQIVEIK